MTQAIERLVEALPEEAALAYLSDKIAYARSRVVKCTEQAAFFRNHEHADTWAPNAEKWEQDGRKAARDLAVFTTLATIAADRDEWRTQHENLLSVRESDLTLIETQAQQIATIRRETLEEAARVAEDAAKPLTGQLSGWGINLRNIAASIRALEEKG